VSDQVNQEGVSVADAVRILGVSEKTIRRRIQQGKLAAFRLDRPQGHEWRVVIDQDIPEVEASTNGHHPHHDQVVDQEDEQTDQVTPDQVTIALRLAETLAHQPENERERTAAAIADRDNQVAERDRRISELEQTRFDLGALVNSFQAQLAIANDRIILLESPKPDPLSIERPIAVVDKRHHWWWPFGR
jgi:hypothetical protein